MDRRNFIKQSCSLCIMMSAGFAIGFIPSCSSVPVYKTLISENKVIVPVSLFEKSNLQIIRPKGLEYDIAVRKEMNNDFTALLLRCTHADNQLIATGNGFICNLHGSKFDSNGAVTKGPAEHALQKFPTQLIDNNLIINIS